MRINAPDKPGPRPGILILFVVLAAVLITVWFREGDGGPLHRVRLTVQAAAAPLQTGGEIVTRPVRNAVSWAKDLGVSRDELQELRDQNQKFRVRLAELEEARLENERLRGLVELSQAQDLESLGARVIGRPASSWEGVITIDRGSSDGVAQGMPVVSTAGLLGQTVEVAAHSAKVRLITDQRSGVAALVQRSRADGIVHGSIDGDLTMDFVAQRAAAKAGDVVITSGMGGVYPKGLIIGEITSVERDASALYLDIEMTPAADIRGLEEVIVLVGTPETATQQGGE